MESANVRWPDSLWAAATPPGPELPELVGTARSRRHRDRRRFYGPVDGAASARGRRRCRHRRSHGARLGRLRAQQRTGDPDAVAARSRGHHRQARRGRRTFRRPAARQRFHAVRRRQALSDPGRAGTGRLGAAGAFAGAHQDRRAAGAAMVEIRRAMSRLLSREQTRQMLGSDAWFGGFWNKTGGHINPLALARGLARVVLERGGRIYARSPAISFERRNDRWVVKTEKGEISGRALIVATNAYTGEFSKTADARHRARSDAGAVLADGDAAAVGGGAQNHHSRPAGDVRYPWRTLFCALRRAQSPGHRRRRDRPRQQGRNG